MAESEERPSERRDGLSRLPAVTGRHFTDFHSTLQGSRTESEIRTDQDATRALLARGAGRHSLRGV